MTRPEIESVLRSYLKTRFSAYRDDLDAGAPLDDIVDSLGLFDLVSHLEETFSMRIPGHEFTPVAFSTIDRIVEMVEIHSAG